MSTTNSIDFLSLFIFGLVMISALVIPFIGIKLDKWKGYGVGILLGFIVQILFLWIWIEYMKWKIQKQNHVLDSTSEFVGTSFDLIWSFTIVSILAAGMGVYAFYKYMGKAPNGWLGVLGFFLNPFVWLVSTMCALKIVTYFLHHPLHI